ncbi:hypothetical protein LJK88_25285 [Paenibacillus sp. P26]|nr:hypothetical protein LJK88_25285 [Paenibacillus sp. P26]
MDKLSWIGKASWFKNVEDEREMMGMLMTVFIFLLIALVIGIASWRSFPNTERTNDNKDRTGEHPHPLKEAFNIEAAQELHPVDLTREFGSVKKTEPDNKRNHIQLVPDKTDVKNNVVTLPHKAEDKVKNPVEVLSHKVEEKAKSPVAAAPHKVEEKAKPSVPAVPHKPEEKAKGSTQALSHKVEDKVKSPVAPRLIR